MAKAGSARPPAKRDNCALPPEKLAIRSLLVDSSIKEDVRPTRRWKRKWDFLAYFAIALVIVASALLYGAYQGRTGGSAELPLKWLGFAGLTAIVFGYATRTGLETKAGRKFWALLTAVFVVRTAIWVLVLAQVEEVPLVVYALAGGPEYMLLLNVLGAFLKPEKWRRPSSRRSPPYTQLNAERECREC